ncbi:unnamed protein product, partial [marine sediment metagenome]
EQLGISKWWMNWECWAQTQEELDYVVNRIRNREELYLLANASLLKDNSLLEP